MKNWIKVFAPASVANVGPGFDIFGFAIEDVGDVVEARRIKKKKVILTEITGDNGKLSKHNNVVVKTAELVLKRIKTEEGIEFKLHKGMPIGSGMGSSGASVVAGAFAANVLFGDKLSKSELLPIVAEGERFADGGYHVDNTGASLLGGFIVIRSYKPFIDVIQIPVPDNLLCVIVRPDFVLLTQKARAVIPKKVQLSKVIEQTGNCAGIIAALYSEDYQLLKRSIDDCIIEPARAHLIPGFYDVKKQALEHGALGCSISGSGPSVFAFANKIEHGKRIGETMQKAFAKHNLKSTIFISKINKEGVKVID